LNNRYIREINPQVHNVPGKMKILYMFFALEGFGLLSRSISFCKERGRGAGPF
jgi:hypothetical protein